jgi:uncharacterized membrane protein (Fun14 family)
VSSLYPRSMAQLLEGKLDASEWVPQESGAQASAAWTAIWLLPVLAAGALAWITVGLVAGFASAAVAAIAVALWIRVQGLLALRSAGAVQVNADTAPRLRNLVEGVMTHAGCSGTPSLWLIEDGGPNALVCDAGGPALAVTRTALDAYSRTELQSVIALCLVRLSAARKLSHAAALGPLGAKVAAPVGFYEDAAAVAITLYPPALASAIEKAEPRSGRFGIFWFAGSGRSHQPRSVRVQRLLDL